MLCNCLQTLQTKAGAHTESCLHISCLELKAVFLALKELRAFLQGPDCVSSNGQHDCGVLHQQGGWYEIRLFVCPSLEGSVLVPPQGNNSEGKAHPWPLERDNRQTVQAPSSDPDRVVPVAADVQSLVLQMGLTTDRPVCYPVQPQTSQVCITGTGSNSLGSRRLEHSENLDVYAFPPVSLLNKVVSSVMDQGCRRMILIVPGDPTCLGFGTWSICWFRSPLCFRYRGI